MRGKIARAQSFTLSIDSCESSEEIECDACQCTISGEVFTVMLPAVAAVFLCRSCAYDLQGDLGYALR